MPRQLDHAGVVAGEGEDVARLGHPAEEVGEGRAQADDAAALAAGLEERGLGDAERLGGVAHAERAAALLERGLAGEQVVGFGGVGHGLLRSGRERA